MKSVSALAITHVLIKIENMVIMHTLDTNCSASKSDSMAFEFYTFLSSHATNKN